MGKPGAVGALILPCFLVARAIPLVGALIDHRTPDDLGMFGTDDLFHPEVVAGIANSRDSVVLVLRARVVAILAPFHAARPDIIVPGDGSGPVEYRLQAIQPVVGGFDGAPPRVGTGDPVPHPVVLAGPRTAG